MCLFDFHWKITARIYILLFCRKDYTTNKLTSGLLQLAPHTHLVLDETKLQPGKLESSGVEAVQSIAHLIKTQKLKYNFQFYQLEFNTDVPVLIFSEGRSMLPVRSYLRYD